MIDPIVSSSIIYGSVLGLMCVGLTLTYMTTKVPNFAHGDFVVIGLYATAVSYLLYNVSPPYLSFPFAFLLSGGVAVLMYLLVIRPLTKRGSGIIGLMIATLAVDIIFTGALSIFVQYVQTNFSRYVQGKGYYLTYLSSLPDARFFDNNALLYISPLLLVLTAVLVYLLLNKTKFGIAMRASIENPNLAEVLGINVNRVYTFSWFLAGGLAGLSGAAYSLGFAAPQNLASLVIVEVFAGSILGGLASIYGALVGGFIVGASEIYITTNLSNLISNIFGSATGSQVLNFQRGIPLIIMIIALLVAPNGLASVRWRRLLGGRNA